MFGTDRYYAAEREDILRVLKRLREERSGGTA
jgi:hypothetical protein